MSKQMLLQIIRRVGKQQKKLLIISSLILLTLSAEAQFFSKQDSVNFKNDLERILKKYGLKTAGYLLNIQSNDQRGGQTAFTITNNSYVTNNNYYDNKTINQAPLPTLKVSEVVYKDKEVNENLFTLNPKLKNTFSIDTFHTFKTFIKFQYFSDSKKDNIDFKVNASSVVHVQMRYVDDMFQTSTFENDFNVVKGVRCFDPANGTYELTFYTLAPIENIWYFVKFYVNGNELLIHHNSL